MNQQSEINPYRITVANLSVLGTIQLHLRNPWIIAWWSAAYPGLGHLLLSKYLRGFLLLILEIIVNYNAKINLAIFYSFIGEVEQAKIVINKDWLLLYCATYIFAIWDSYRTTVDLNNQYKLAAREDAKVEAFKISSLEINYLDKRSPLNSLIWSAMMPGTGQLYIHRILVATFIIVWWFSQCYLSKILPATHYSFFGQFEQAKSVLHIQWFLNIPSIYIFSIYDAYTNTIENNKLYDWEQSKFLIRQYQCEKFKMPIKDGKYRRESMYIIATFEHNIFLEMAITAIQMKGVQKERILAAPLDKGGEVVKLFDSIHRSDGLSLIDLAAVLGSIFMVLGAIYGFVLEWGPIWWGLIGMFFGFAVGIIIKLYTTKKYSESRNKDPKGAEVVLIIECNENEAEMIKSTLWEHHALGVSKLDFEHVARI